MMDLLRSRLILPRPLASGFQARFLPQPLASAFQARFLPRSLASAFRARFLLPPRDTLPRGLLSLRPLALFSTGALLLQGCALVGGQGAPPPAPSTGGPSTAWTQAGIASWYGEPFHGRRTASGETYDMNKLTCAHRTLPFGTRLRVQNLDNGRSITLRVNDRGPFVDGRILDVSRKAAQELGIIGPGTARVRITTLEARRD